MALRPTRLHRRRSPRAARRPLWSLTALIGALGLVGFMAGCGDEPTAPFAHDLVALCDGRPTELPVRLIVTSVDGLPAAVGDTIAATLRFTPDSPGPGGSGACPVAGHAQLLTSASVLAWPRDSTTLSFQSVPSAQQTHIGVAGSGDDNVFMATLAVRDSVGTWNFFRRSLNASVGGTLHYAVPVTR